MLTRTNAILYSVIFTIALGFVAIGLNTLVAWVSIVIGKDWAIFIALTLILWLCMLAILWPVTWLEDEK